MSDAIASSAATAAMAPVIPADGLNPTIAFVHISAIRVGDTIVLDGNPRTVSRNNMKHGWMGKTLFGDSYKLGREPVPLVIITKAMPHERSTP